MPTAGLPGGAIIGSAGGERADLNHLGPAELSDSLGLFIYGPSPSAERESVVFKGQAGMEIQFVPGHTVSGSSLSASAVGALILCTWGSAGQGHPSIVGLPEGRVDIVTRWVSSHR